MKCLFLVSISETILWQLNGEKVALGIGDKKKKILIKKLVQEKNECELTLGNTMGKEGVNFRLLGETIYKFDE